MFQPAKHLTLWLVFVFLAVFTGITPALWGQGLADDVHLAPRVKTPEKPPLIVDPALRTNTKPIRKDVDLVLVPVTITDPMNRLVTGLDRENFQLFEGKEAQDIKHFSSEDAPVSIGVIFDMSGSMSSKIDRAREFKRATSIDALAEARRCHIPDMAAKTKCRRDGAFAVNLCTEAVSLLFSASGARGLFTSGVLQRQFRDAHAINSHIAFNFDAAGTNYGRVALGLPSENLTL